MQRSVALVAMPKPHVRVRVSAVAERSTNVLHSFTNAGAASAASSAPESAPPLDPDVPDVPLEPEEPPEEPLEPDDPELLPPVLSVELLHAAIATTARKGTASKEKGRSMAQSVAEARPVG